MVKTHDCEENISETIFSLSFLSSSAPLLLNPIIQLIIQPKPLKGANKAAFELLDSDFFFLFLIFSFHSADVTNCLLFLQFSYLILQKLNLFQHTLPVLTR